MMPWMPTWDTAVPPLSLVLLHFVWQGFAVWVIALCVLHVMRASAPQVRYATYCGFFVLLAICPLVTFCVVCDRPVSHLSHEPLVESSATVDVVAVSFRHPRRTPAHWASSATAAVARLEPVRNGLVAIWLTGAALLASRLVFASVGLATIKRRRRAVPRELESTVHRMIGQLAFRRWPMVCVVDELSQAMAVGLFKPLVLLPASWLSELPPHVLEIVIAHELAHLRRWDLAINLFQRVVECLLFFHPVVWWCSKRMRVEREICCDALAVRLVGDRVQYAKALTYLADQRTASTEPLLAAGIGGPKMVLLERIRNVLGLAAPKRGPFYGTTCAAAGAAAASIIWLSGVAVFYASASSARTADEPAVGFGQAAPLRVPLDNSDGTFADEQTYRFMFGAQVARWGDKGLPNENEKTTLAPYVIEPPDILWIEATRQVARQPRPIQAGDDLLIQYTDVSWGGFESYGVNTTQRRVDTLGWLDFGPFLPVKVKVTGLTKDQAAKAIHKEFLKHDKFVHFSVYSLGAPRMQPIKGEHLVDPDGNVNLGSYGQIYVAGRTVEEAKAVIDQHLTKHLDKPDVSVSVFASNSKMYYVVMQGADAGDTVSRYPITGNETVLDALAQSGGAQYLSTKKIWISRPTPGAAEADTILPVNWKKISPDGFKGTNHQLLPGDRIYISDKASSR